MALTDEEKAALTTEITDSLGKKFMSSDQMIGAIKDHVGRSSRDLEKSFTDKQAEVLTALAELKGKADDGGGSGDDDGKGGNGNSGGSGLSSEVEKRLQMAEKRAEAAEKMAQDQVTLREQEAVKMLRNEERTRLGEALVGAGVAKEMLPAAIAYLTQRMFREDKTNNILLRQPGDDLHPEVKLMDGVTNWTKTDEGERFLPPRTVQGSGATGSAGAQRGRGGSDLVDDKGVMTREGFTAFYEESPWKSG